MRSYNFVIGTKLLYFIAKRKVFSKRSANDENKIMRQFCDDQSYGPDEDAEMFKLAFQRLKEEKDDLVDDVPWAYILSFRYPFY